MSEPRNGSNSGSTVSNPGVVMDVKESNAKYLLPAELQLPKGYKQTEVGVIPEDWTVRTLDSLGKRARPAIKAGPFGSALTKDVYVREGYKVYGQEQVIRGDYLYGDYFISKDRFNSLKSCSVESGDILLSLVGTAGRILLLPKGTPEGIINPRLIRFSFDPEVISPLYFRFLFESETYQALLARGAQGGTMGVLNAGFLRPICIPLPSKPEQEAIAEALNDANALIETLEQRIAKKRQLKQGAMQELLTGKRRLPGFSGEWEMRTLGELASIQRGASPRPIDSPIWFDENSSVGWVRISDVTKSKIYLRETMQRLSKLGI